MTLAVLVVWGFGGSFFLRGVLPPRPNFIDDGAPGLYVAHGLAFTAWMLLPMLWWDWRSLGRIHPATAWGGLSLLATNSAMIPLGLTQAWQDLMASITG